MAEVKTHKENMRVERFCSPPLSDTNPSPALPKRHRQHLVPQGLMEVCRTSLWLRQPGLQGWHPAFHGQWDRTRMPRIASRHFLGSKYRPAIRPTPRVLAPGGGQEVPGSHGQDLPGPSWEGRALACSLSLRLPTSMSEGVENCCIPRKPRAGQF